MKTIDVDKTQSVNKRLNTIDVDKTQSVNITKSLYASVNAAVMLTNSSISDDSSEMANYKHNKKGTAISNEDR